MLISSAFVWTVVAVVIIIISCCPATSIVAEGRESAYQFVKRRAACLDLGGDIDHSIPPYQNWFDHVIFGNPTINVSVSGYLHGMGPVLQGAASSAVQEGLRTFGKGLVLYQERDEDDASHPRSSSTPQYTPHFQQVMRRVNTTLPVYAGLCEEGDEVHHLRTMQCVGMLGLTSQSSLYLGGGEESSSSSLSFSSGTLTPEERKANRRKRAVAKALYGGGPESEMSADEGALRQQLWCRALLTCDGGRNGFMDLCGHVIAPIARMRRDALELTLTNKKYIIVTKNIVHADTTVSGLSATVLVRHRLLRTQERRRLQERRDEREFDEEDAAEEARNRIVQASMRFSRERPGEGDDLLSISSKTALSDDSNTAESFLVY